VCNQGPGTGSLVTVTDAIDTTNLDETTINAPGATSVLGNTITWDIMTLAPGSPGTPTCQDLEFWVNVRSGVADGTEICNAASITSFEWATCGSIFPTPAACFTTGGPTNQLLREWCAAIDPPCDLTTIWDPDLAPYPLSLAAAPGSVDDPETGILADVSKQLVFYEVTNPLDPNAVRCLKNDVGQTVTIYY
jgi:hypothetical protein